MSLPEFGEIASQHINLVKRKRGEEGFKGIFPATCQGSSLHTAHTQWKNPKLPVIQVGHWIAAKFPEEYGVQFVNLLNGMLKTMYYPDREQRIQENLKDKYVIFTDLVPGSCARMIEMAEYPKKPDDWKLNKADITSIKIEEKLDWQAVEPNIWYPVKYIFRMKSSTVPGAVVIHKTMPHISPNAVEMFCKGNNSYWCFDQYDNYIQKSPIEESRADENRIIELLPCCQRVLLGTETQEAPEAVPEAPAEPAPAEMAYDSDATEIDLESTIALLSDTGAELVRKALSFQTLSKVASKSAPLPINIVATTTMAEIPHITPFTMAELEADTAFQIPKVPNEFSAKWSTLLEAANQHGRIEVWGSAAFLPIRHWTVSALEPHPLAIPFLEEGVKNHFLEQYGRNTR